jgi:hypothetical protein
MAKRLKVYYPKGQIQNGLYTQGKEWMSPDGTEYVGDYHTYSTGEVFTKGVYLKGVSEKLIKYVDLSLIDNSEKFKYDSLNKLDVSFNFAVYGISTPIESDYVNGYFIRYFVKRHFNDIITEVNKDVYSTISTEFYKKTEVRWKLVDNADFVNRKQIELGNETIKGLSNYITNYSEFLK